MKKFLALILAAMMLLTLVACNTTETPEDGKNDSSVTTDAPNTTEAPDTTEAPAPQLDYANSVELLTKIWGKYADDEKFMCFGGYDTTMVDATPGAMSLEGEDAASTLNALLLYPIDDIAKIEDAASLFHGMMLNNFSAGAYHFADEATADAMAEALKKSLLESPYMCGMPEKILVIKAPGNYVITLFGLEHNTEIFKTHALEAIEGAEIIADELYSR